MKIVVMGTCRKCKMTFDLIERVISETGSDAQLSREEDIEKIIEAGVRTVPAVTVDGKVAVRGYIPSEREIREMLDVG